MKRWISYYCPLIVICILASFGFNTTKIVEVPETLIIMQPTPVLFPKNKTTFTKPMAVPPFLGSSYVGFKEALAFKESQGNYFSINTLGYLGKYQFGIGTLQLMGVYNATQFLNDPVLQEKVFHTNIERNKWILRKDIEKFVGKEIRGVKITESGILAAAHLAGAGNVKKYLRSYGSFDAMDSYGTSISHYLKKFSGYDVSTISARRNPKV
jgi:hypothetical protein